MPTASLTRGPVQLAVSSFLVLVGLGLASIAPSAGGDIADLEAAARKVIECLAKYDYPGAMSNFDSQLTAALPEAKLQKSWHSVLDQCGPFQRIADVRPERRGTGDYMMVTCTFARQSYDVRLLFNERRRLAVLKFLPSALGGPGLIRATSTARVRPAQEGVEGTITFPVPGTYRDQVPLDFVVSAKPPEALKSHRLRKRDDGLNWLCEARVAPPKDGALVRWEALVLVGDRPSEVLPKAAQPNFPEEVRPWLKSTGCVQSDDPAIKAKAEDLAKDVTDVETYARRVTAFTSLLPIKPDRFMTLDARNAIACGGSCTSRANLAAALLRAHGIPARTVAHLPTWSGPLYEHWLVEYWHPGKGWTWLESSLNQFQPAPTTLVVLNVANPADEDERATFASARIRGVMAGAPYLSVQELSTELLPVFERLDPDEVTSLATPEVRLRGTPEELRGLFRTAEQHFARWSSKEIKEPGAGRANELVTAARHGGLKKLSQELIQ